MINFFSMRLSLYARPRAGGDPISLCRRKNGPPAHAGAGAAVGMLLLGACVNAPGPQDSGITAPFEWSRLYKTSQMMSAQAPVEQRWWTHFNDPMLDQLLNEAVANNKDLAIARQRVIEARANRHNAIANLLPQSTGVANASRSKSIQYPGPVNDANASLQASWEIDLFGKNQARAAQEDALLEAEDANTQGTLVSLLADVARNYFDLRNQQRQVEITQRNLESQKETLRLTKAQFQGGQLSNFDVQRAAAQVSTTAAELPLARAAYDADLNALSVLLGQVPGSKDALLKPQGKAFKPLDTQVVVAAPAAVLANRPDIKAAERQFAAAISAKDFATRQLFPTISLTGLYGIEGGSFPTIDPWSLAAGLTVPLLNFGTITSQIDAADARQQQAFLAYQRTVLEALQDMENALSAYGNEVGRNQSLVDSFQQNSTAARLAKLQFTNGDIALIDLLIINRDALNAEAALAASDADLRKDLVHIYTAAGGGWQVQGGVPPVSTAPQPAISGAAASQSSAALSAASTPAQNNPAASAIAAPPVMAAAPATPPSRVATPDAQRAQPVLSKK